MAKHYNPEDHPYPKWVTRPDGSQFIAQTADEETRALAVAVASLEAPNEIEPRKGGWPKGKPRKPNEAGE